jgi:hypothetical protein
MPPRRRIVGAVLGLQEADQLHLPGHGIAVLSRGVRNRPDIK